MSVEKQKMLRLAGVLSIIGALLCAVSDLLLMCGPVSAKDINLIYMASNIPYNRTMTGAILGVAVIPLWLFVLFPLYHALKPAGKWFAIPVILIFAHLIAVSTAYHGAYAFYSAGYYALANVGGEAKTILLEMIDKFMVFRTGLFYTVVTISLLGSVWFIIAVLFRPTLYKRWMVIFTPLLIIPVGILCKQLPAPIGGYMMPPSGSIVFAVFFMFATVVTWKLTGNVTKK